MFTLSEHLTLDNLKNLEQFKKEAVSEESRKKSKEDFEKGIGRGRNRDEQIRAQRENLPHISSNFTKWILADGNIDENTLRTREKVYFPELHKKYGEWPKNRENLSHSKNLAYKFAEIGLEVVFSQGELDIDDKLTDTTNLAAAEMAVISLSAYRKVLSFLADYNYPSNITNTIATRMQAIYLQSVYDGCSIKFGESVAHKYTNQLDRQISTILSQNNDFDSSMHPKSKTYELFNTMLNNKVPTENDSPQSSNPQGNWLYYSATREWPYSTVSRTICSHSNGFPITDYFSRDFVPNGGVLLVGKPIKYFCRDMDTHRDELEMGQEWSIESFIATHKDLMYERAKEHHITQDEVEKNNLNFKSYICTSLQEAWDRRKESPRFTITGAYTEIWLDDPQEYAIWVDARWQTDPDFHRSYVADATLRLLNQRPDLPIIDSTGSIVSRNALVERILHKDSV